MDTPDDPPASCPVCDTDYDSVSVHEEGLMVNLLDNERYRRVCFEPHGNGNRPQIKFYHHTHEQVHADETDTSHERDGADGTDT